MQKVILVVEHDSTLRNMISSQLRREGYFVLAVADETMALEAALYNPLSLVLIDPLRLQPDGLDFCRQLRSSHEMAHLPILMMVNNETEIAHMVGREPYVNDFIMKPLKWEELRACIYTLTTAGKRGMGQKIVKVLPETGATQNEEHMLVADDLCIDVGRYRVTRGNQDVKLHGHLFNVLVHLVRNRGKVVTREQLLRDVWRNDQLADSRTVDVHIRWLRARLEDDSANPKLIQTVRGLGYRFKDEE
jgi:DNA-binding response OmpR family regulator